MAPTFFQRYSRLLLGVAACLFPLAGWAALHAYDVRDNGVLGWLPARSPVTIAYENYRRIFGSDEAVLASWEGCKVDDPALEQLAKAVEAHRALAAEGKAPNWFANVSTGTRLRDAVAAAGQCEPEEAAKRLAGVLVGPDGASTCVAVTLESMNDIERRKVVDWVAEQAAEVVGINRDQVRLTGDAVIGVAIDTESERTASTWSNLAVILSLVIAWISIGSFRVGSMVLAVGGFASVASEAAIYCSGMSMNMLVALVPVCTFVLGVSAAVHLAAYWRDAVVEHGTELAPTKAVFVGWQPSFVAALTTVLGVGSLCTSDVRPVWQFGLFGAIGTTIAFVSVFLFLPALLQVFPGTQDSVAGDEWPSFGKAVRSQLPWNHYVAFGCLVVTLVTGVGLWMLRTEVRPSRFLSHESQWIQDLDWFTKTIGPFQTVDVVLAFDNTTTGLADRAALVQEAQDRLRQGHDIVGSLSAATFLPEGLLGYSDRGAARSVVRRGVIDGKLRRLLPELLASGMVGVDGNRQLWRITLQSHDFTPEKQDRLREDVYRTVAAAAKELGVASPAETICTGGVPLAIAAQQSLLNAFLESFIMAFVTIAIVLVIFLRSLTAGLLAMLPNIFPVVVIFGIIGWMGRRIDVGGMMTASVALGIAVDDTVHLLTWFHRFRDMPGTAIDRVAAALGRAAVPMARTTLILAPSFGIFTFCGFQPIAQFGLLLFLLLAVALVGDLVMLPALLSGPLGRWFEGSKNLSASSPSEAP